MAMLKGTIRGRARYVFAMTVAAILGVLTIAGCGSGSSLSTAARQLIHEHPWLAPLSLAFLEGLMRTFGSDLPGLLAAAATALAG
jgi:hypothetical protein